MYIIITLRNIENKMKSSFLKIVIIFSIIFVGFGTTTLSVDGQSNIIPEWVKNTAGWWSEDQISETEYVTSLQYLIDEKIINVQTNPITNVFATDAAISDEERAHSFAVRVKNPNYDLDDTYYSFIQFFNRNEASGQPRGTLTGSPDSPEFVLGSLPSHDKEKLYSYVSMNIKPGAQIDMLESVIEVSVLDKNGKSINTWKYRDCTLLDYLVYLDFDKENYRWSQTDDKEIRELFVFQCRGFTINT